MVITDVADIGIDSWVALEKGSWDVPDNCKLGCGPQNDMDKVEICHHASDVNEVTICISVNALETRIQRHGDFCGKCPGDEESAKSSLSGAVAPVNTVASALLALAALVVFMV